MAAASASCGSSSLTDPATPEAGRPLDVSDADCVMFNPTACQVDVPKTTLGIDVHYPNSSFCALRLLPTKDFTTRESLDVLAGGWEVTMDDAVVGQRLVLAPDLSRGDLDYPLGEQQLYLTRVTFTSRSSDTLDVVVGRTLGPTASMFAVPIDCVRPAGG